MRALVLSKAFPDDPERKVHGVYQRLGMFVEALGEMAELDGLFFVPPEIDTSPESRRRYEERLSAHWGLDFRLTMVPREREARSRWETYGPGIVDGFRQPKFRWASGPGQQEALERALTREPDLLFVHRLASMAPVLRTERPLPPVCFDLDDLEHVALRRGIREPPVWPGKWLRLLHLPALWWGERRAIAHSTRTFVCSEADRRHLSRTMRVSGLAVVPNAVEIHDPLPPPSEPTALFLGAYNHSANRAAAAFLLREIWPRVRRARPDARLVVAGKHPELVEGYAEPSAGVEFPGFVENLEDLYARTRVVCVPILSGGGTRLKVLEAAAFGKPIVSTPLGVEGLKLEDGRHLLVREDAEGLAAEVLALLDDEARCRRLGLAAHAAVREAYARERVIERIRAEIAEAIRAG